MNISLFKSQKGVYLPAGADVASGTSWRADLARGATALRRRGTEATWQGSGWSARRAGGASGADTWQEATWSTRVHANAREGRHVAEGGWQLEGPRVSGPRL